MRNAGATLAAVLTWAVVLTGVTGCTAAEDLLGKSRSPEDAIEVVPANGTKNVPADRTIEVKVPDGRLQTVKVVKLQDGEEVPVQGRIDEHGARWRPTGERRLSLAAKYTVDVVARDKDGHRTARHTTFTTSVPAKRFVGYVTPEDRSTVGTGMIVSLEFNRAIQNRAAVERAIHITTKPAVEVAPHWFGKSRLDFRPRDYWKPGTEVTVDLGLRDVQSAPGVYGVQHKKMAFTIGRSQVSLVDADDDTMEVRREGEPAETIPITAGATKTPTYNGKMVISEMLEMTRMDSRTVGFGGEYNVPDVPHAIRLTSSGTFLHGNYWTSDAFGNRNISHGCIGLADERGGSSDSPAGWFFDHSLVGDVIEVVNSKDKVVAPDNGLSGWNMTWKDWTAGTAAH
ncbi:Ig-like domain-containing protein [Streptomyces sp. NPDC051956]|uniref:L,D-transpeptidase n=1 Tax=Streptomyces sp. NPDC051956 TaxID=3365677 RepID=UPI0037D5B93C